MITNGMVPSIRFLGEWSHRQLGIEVNWAGQFSLKWEELAKGFENSLNTISWNSMRPRKLRAIWYWILVMFIFSFKQKQWEYVWLIKLFFKNLIFKKKKIFTLFLF